MSTQRVFDRPSELHAHHLTHNYYSSDRAGVIKLSTADTVSFYNRKYRYAQCQGWSGGDAKLNVPRR